MMVLIRVIALALMVSPVVGCTAAGSGPLSASAPMASPTPVPAAAAPTWNPGDRWTYVWTSGKDQGSKTVEVRDLKDVNGVRYYIVRNAEADHYWTLDLHWAGSVRDSKVEARMVPAEPWYVWPLQVGQQWQHRGEYEQAGGKRAAEDAFVVVGTATVEVPAGRFLGFKITRTGRGGDSDEYWYVPEVRSYVRWIGRRGSVQFEERLSAYQAAGPPSPSSEPPRSPSSLK